MKTIKTTTEDGLIYAGQLFESENKENIIISIHGMAGDIYTNSYYPYMQEEYPKNGYSFLACEHRGTHSVTLFTKEDGTYTNIGNAFEIFEDSQYDIKAWIEKAKELGYKNIWLQGHSLAPSKLAYYIHNHPHEDIEGLIFLSPVDMQGDMLYEDNIELFDELRRESLELQKEGKENQLLSKTVFDCYLSAKTFLNSWGEGSNIGIFNYYTNKDWDVVNRIDLPVIALTGTKDESLTILDRQVAMDMLEKELINSPRVKTIVYDGGNHDFKGVGDEVVKDILEFIKQK